MKAGIVTFHEADNFGAVLQAYALQKVLEKLGTDSEFVSFSGSMKKQETLFPTQGPTALFARRIIEEGEKRAELFQSFRAEYMKCSRPFDVKDREALDQSFDFFVAGSDQIWNFRIPGVDGRYFLPFAQRYKKYSYAASFGSEDFPEKVKEWCAMQLKDFQGLSVREAFGQTIIKELTGRNSVVSLDPTLLLSKEEWSQIASDPGEKPYDLLFMVKYDPVLHQQAKNHATVTGAELKMITAAFMPQCGFPAWSQVSVQDWIGLMAHSSATFTNSFHGTAFSLLFERPVAVAGVNGELSKRNGRMEDLLYTAGLKKAMDGSLWTPEPGAIHENLAGDREASIQYLKDMIDHAADS